MSKLMTIAGIILAAVAVALGLMIFFSPSSVVGWGITPQAAIELLVGGILAIGLGGVIGAMDRLRNVVPAEMTAERPLAVTTVTEAVVLPAAAAEDSLSPATSETLRALDQAKTEIHKAFGEAPPEIAAAAPEPVEQAAAPVAATVTAGIEAVADEEAEAAPEEDDGQLYVIEERVVHGRPARVLSDGTIEAETDEGWMRFENIEHLNEYLDAMAPGR